jgi:predicted transcriptional regulator
MTTTVRLDETTAAALRRRAELEHRSMRDCAGQAIREYIEQQVRADWLGQILDEELSRYSEALDRLGR